MKRLVWSENFSIGIDSIDEQHQKLIGIINRLHDLADYPESEKNIVNEVILDLIDYTQYHFRTEEEAMQSIHYEDYFLHKNEHEAFIKEIQVFHKEFLADNIKSTEILFFLYNWLGQHILQIDKKMGISIIAKKALF